MLLWDGHPFERELFAKGNERFIVLVRVACKRVIASFRTAHPNDAGVRGRVHVAPARSDRCGCAAHVLIPLSLLTSRARNEKRRRSGRYWRDALSYLQLGRSPCVSVEG